MRVSRHAIGRAQHTCRVLSLVLGVYADEKNVEGARAPDMRVWETKKKAAPNSLATPRCADIS